MSKALTVLGDALGSIEESVKDTGLESESLGSAVQPVINIVIFLVGVVAVVMVILGGIRYSTSQGDAGKVKSAKDTIMYGIIGLVIAMLAFAIVNFVLQGVFVTPTPGAEASP